MTAAAINLAKPRFRRGQRVSFIGGAGVINTFHSESGTWFYLVEMALDPTSAIKRIGYETMIWMPETDLFLLTNPQSYGNLAVA